ncbi:zinc ribbon domain-containing protein [Ornithinicoccus hortensis]|uniref:Uncharacterized protein n=1 Tax=Ornithinicoccus hortensis TaxID=82346 RepID=A0A542YUV5_9MICO|nr:zinc ribbon domain-containing protein [Ornithinicoccus hortensis]TQL51866.1 hypothetical protein FB467_3033 [Ornithinicoccus hortensis]
MAEEPCTVCGERNPISTQFCNFCGAYLGWDDEDEPTQPVLVDEPVSGRVRTERVLEESTGDRYPDSTAPPEETTRILLPALDPGWALDAEILQPEVVVTPGSPPGTVTLRVSNTSTTVEAYGLTVVNPPPWLRVTPGRVQLLPGTDEAVQVHLAIRAEDLVPVQRARLRFRVQGESAVSLRRDVSVDLVVGAVSAPLGMRVEPSTLRARDSTTALFRVILDNRRNNEAVRVRLGGSDPEMEASFRFTPPELEVPPGAALAARVRVEAPLPEPGERLARTLTVTASDGYRQHHATATFLQSAAATVVDPPVTVRLDPRTVQVVNTSAGATSVVLDNRRGTRSQRVTLSAADDEGAVRFTISPTQLEVPAGLTATARLTMRAPRPDGGSEHAREITVTAWSGQDSVEARGRFVQTSPDRRPLTRATLTVLGSSGIAVGTALPWTRNPENTGHQWSFTRVNDHLGIQDDRLVATLEEVRVRDTVDAVVSGGSIALLLAVVVLFGLTGQTGRLTRVAALLCLVFVLLLLTALNVQSSAGVGVGTVVVLLGCVTAFTGGLLARR